uniref:Uncharacterized protein n=1 Tax=Minutocellus polymorphus TaxID=265543 RepID=A0A7S0B0E5_9STRA|mmetsp:Transcript_7820/g.13024  ORF Transcript_7820/g.13024 Transcript_7820/m.13024 type:complete len:186 (+) Transcript_7820:215-772(+)|eukprot:CAMPEP_0197719620 /NCGR_PEP_ID=MMETSP1434-20131217/3305_1 /TAXON_ID=265543 /ORGANISM="Minutocellus polymorphus, Strain CCMP3303" /LENGTH=185 /DNA_ID=CAMNT_0043304385 /DNA_START=203 /DNA_END=760 /DNA_ORIENTATION=+
MLFLLCLKGDLEGVHSICLDRTANICVSVRATNSDETREKVVFNPSETLEQEGSDREPAHHFALTWEGQKKKSIIQVLDEAQVKAAMKKKAGKKKGGGGGSEVGQPREITAEDTGEFVPVLALECRGLEPYAFHPMGEEFIVTSEGGAEFSSDLTLDEGDWADYDDENDVSVGISEFVSKFVIFG